MAKYRKKPVVIEAEQYHAGELPMPFADDGYPLQFDEDTGQQYIDTLEGWHIVTDGDWIIKGIAGEFYPCKPAIFAATYEPVED